MKSLNTQSGLSIIATVFALLIFSLFIAVAVSLVTTGAQVGLQEVQGVEAFSIADGGLEKALYYIIKQKDAACITSETCACNNINGDPAFTDISLGNGTFTVTSPASDQEYVTNPTTLAANVTAAQTSIPVTSDPTGVYAPYGRIMIDREIIEYTSLTANSFEGCRRGVAGTTPAAHSTGTRVGQKQCVITSEGDITTNPFASVQRRVSTVAELQEGWAVGGAGLPTDNLNSIYCVSSTDCWAVGDNGTIARWNGTTWSDVTESLSPTTRDLNEVHCTNVNNCWAVGNNDGNELILRWDGATWSRLGPFANVANGNLNSVYMVSATEVWIVGDDRPGGPNALAYRWSDTNGNGIVENAEWVYFDPGTDENLNSVYMLSSNDGWTVGNTGVIRRWNYPCAGGLPNNQWNNCASLVDSNLNSVYCTASNNCWAVGDTWNPPGPPPTQEVILQWDGTNWTLLPASASIPNRNLNGVYCVDANNCWAVGNNGTIIRYSAGSWSSVASPTGQNLNSVYMISATDGWAVGDNGTILRWNGANWSVWVQGATMLRWNSASWRDTSGGLPADTRTLNSISMLSYTDGWAVGNRIDPVTDGWMFIRWDGTNWSRVIVDTAPTGARNLNSIYMVSSIDGWAVGNRTGATTTGWTFLRWNNPTANTWNLISVGPTPSIARNLNSVYMIDTNNDGIAEDGWAVGNVDLDGIAPDGEIILRWQAGLWSQEGPSAVLPDVNLNSVHCVSSNDCWAVGNRIGAVTNGWTFLRWSGANWSLFTVDTAPTIAQNLNSVFMLDIDGDGDADDGWAVGNRIANATNGWTFLRWDGSSWNRVVVTTTVNAQNLNSVYMISSTEGWAMGRNGVILRWDGASWSIVTSPTSADLNELYILGTSSPMGQWKEEY